MEVDPEEVKRHLNILGYTHVEPNLLNEFVKDLRKLIEYDRKQYDTSVLLSSPNRENADQTYSDRMKTSTPNSEHDIRHGRTSPIADEQEFHIKKKQKIQEYTLQNSSKILHQDNKNYRNQYSKCKSEFMHPKCYFCGYVSKENHKKARVKNCSNLLHALCIGATIAVEI